jgi:hypothetical protein
MNQEILNNFIVKPFKADLIMADITDKKGKKLEWYKYVVKRYLRDILQDLANSKNQMERSYYETRYACQLDAFAKALNVRPKLLEKYIIRNSNLLRE